MKKEMKKEMRLIDANALLENLGEEPMVWSDGEAEIQERNDWKRFKACVEAQDTVDAYTEEQVASIIQQANQLEAKNKELEKECSWLKSCLNCKIRKECPRHCGKVVHDCDHWEYGDSTVDAVEVVRCKDCKRYCKSAIGSDDCLLLCVDVKPDDYCSHGERKDNG